MERVGVGVIAQMGSDQEIKELECVCSCVMSEFAASRLDVERLGSTGSHFFQSVG